MKVDRPRRDSNTQTSDSKSDALSIRPRGQRQQTNCDRLVMIKEANLASSPALHKTYLFFILTLVRVMSSLCRKNRFFVDRGYD